METIQFKEAKRRKLLKYFNGKYCKHGHLSERYVSDRKCLGCQKESQKARDALYYKNNKDKVNSKNRQRYHDNKEDYQKTQKEWVTNNRGRYNAIKARYRASKLRATPSWLSESMILEITSFYNIAKWYKSTMHVDHIIPLQGKNVCGLHVPWNLQILTASENSSKSNTLRGE
tara:strand:+ start:41 stop:559 length:519 start_codon:yes stop_codon:yes gene_type:complete